MSIAENMLRPLFRRMSKPVAAQFAEKNCNFAQISIEKKTIIYGVKETGEIIEEISTGDFSAANEKISNMVADAPDISKFVASILIYTENEFIIAKVQSKILGNMNFKFNIDNNGE